MFFSIVRLIYIYHFTFAYKKISQTQKFIQYNTCRTFQRSVVISIIGE